jgi:hypothetical protein
MLDRLAGSKRLRASTRWSSPKRSIATPFRLVLTASTRTDGAAYGIPEIQSNGRDQRNAQIIPKG